jgi:hypothetical protein
MKTRFISSVYRIIISGFLIASTGGLQGQVIQNGDFENWTAIPNTFGGEDPAQWKSTNAATAGGNIKAITKDPDAYHGNYALQIKPLISFDENDTITAGIVLGTAPLSFSHPYKLTYEKGGLPAPYQKVTSVQGYYKLIKGFQTFDSVYAIVHCKDGSAPGLAGTGYFLFDTASSYKRFVVNLQQAGTACDTLMIAFLYRSNSSTPFSNAELLVDSLTVSGGSVTITGTVTTRLPSEQEPFPFLVRLAKNEIQILTHTSGKFFIQLLSIEGRLLYQREIYIEDKHLLILPGQSMNGIITITDSEGHRLTRKYFFQ